MLYEICISPLLIHNGQHNLGRSSELAGDLKGDAWLLTGMTSGWRGRSLRYLGKEGYCVKMRDTFSGP